MVNLALRSWYRLVVNPICRSVCLFVCRSVWKVYCGKTADWIWKLLGLVSGAGRKMGVLDGGGDHRK